jgi:hypothetical protein
MECNFYWLLFGKEGQAIAWLVEAKCCKLEGRAFDSRLGNRIFQLT